MNKTFQTILQIKATVNANTFLYYLKRLWVIGKHVPDRVYREEGLKNFLAVLTTVLGQLLKLFGKAVYLGLAAWLPLMLALEKGLLEPAQAPAQLVNILFFAQLCSRPDAGQCGFRRNAAKIYCAQIYENAAEALCVCGSYHALCAVFPLFSAGAACGLPACGRKRLAGAGELC